MRSWTLPRYFLLIVLIATYKTNNTVKPSGNTCNFAINKQKKETFSLFAQPDINTRGIGRICRDSCANRDEFEGSLSEYQLSIIQIFHNYTLQWRLFHWSSITEDLNKQPGSSQFIVNYIWINCNQLKLG